MLDFLPCREELPTQHEQHLTAAAAAAAKLMRPMAFLSSAHHLCVLKPWLYLEWTGCAWMLSTERYAMQRAAAAHLCFKHNNPADLCCCSSTAVSLQYK
jgi:hypothetical protein